MPEPGGGGWGGREGIIARVQMLLDEASARQVEQEFEKAGQQGGESFKKGLSPALDAIRGMFQGLVTGIAGFFTARFLVDFARGAVDAFQVSERAANAYRVAAERVHTSNLQIASDIQQMQELAKKTPFGEEEIVRAGEQLVVILKDEKLAMEALPVVLDVAAARHMDLFRAASLVGGAINGNRTGLGYLKLTIDQNNDVLPQLRAQIGGTAEKMTPLDKVTRLVSEAWHDFRKAVGAAIVEGGNGTTMLDALTGTIRGATTWVKENQVVFDALGVTIKIVSGTLGVAGDAFKGVTNIVAGTVMTVFSGLAWTLTAIVRGFQAVATGYGWLAEKLGNEAGARVWRERAADLKKFADESERVARAAWREGYGQPTPGEKRGAMRGRGLSFIPGVGLVDPQGNVVEPDTTGATIGVPGMGGGEPGTRTKGLEAAQKRAEDFVKAIRETMEQLQKETEAGEKEVFQLQQDLEKAAAEFTVTMVDDMEAALSALEHQLAESGMLEGWKPVLEKARAQIEEVKVFEPIAEEIKSLEPLLGKSLDADVVQGNIDVIEERIGIVEEHIRGLVLAGADPQTMQMWESFLKHLQSLKNTELRQLKEALGLIPDQVDQGTQATTRWEDSLIAVLSVVQNVGSALLGVLDTLGLANSETRQLVGGLMSAGSIISHSLSINPKTGKAFGFDFGAVSGLVGAGLSVISGIGGLLGFGESAEEKAHREALEANNVRLQELRLAVERLTTSMTGAQASRISQALGDIIAANPGAAWDAKVSKEALMPWLEKRGISWAEFLRGAQEAGITLTPEEGITFEQIRDYYASLPRTAGGPGGSFAQKREAQRLLETTAPGTVSPADQMASYIQLLIEEAPDLFGSLRGVDLTTAAGLAKVQQVMGELAMRLASRRGIPLAELGGLSEADLRQAIADLSGSAKQLQEDAKQEAITGEEEGVKERAQEEFGKQVTDAIDAATKRGGAAADQARRVADLYQSWLNIRATAAGGPEGALAGEAYEKLQKAMADLDTLMGVSGVAGETTGWNVSRTFTVAQGDVVTGELRTSNLWLERIEGHLAAMHRVIAPTGGGVNIGELHLTTPGDLTNPVEWGKAAADAFGNQVDRNLGAKYQNDAVLSGNASLP